MAGTMISGVDPLDRADSELMNKVPRPQRLDVRSGLGAKVVLIAADTIAMLAAVGCALLVEHSLRNWGSSTTRSHLILAAISAVIWPVVFAQHRLYGARFVTRLFDELRRLSHAIFIGVVALVVVAGLARLDISRPFTLEVLVFGVVIVGLERFVARRLFARRRSRGASKRSVLIVGTSIEALALGEMLDSAPELGYEIVGFVDDDPEAPPAVRGVPVYSDVSRAPALAEELGAQGVIIAASAMTLGRSNHLVREFSDAGLHVEITWPLRDIAAHRLTVRPLGRFPVAYVEPVVRGGWRSAAKRAFDIVVAGCALLVTAPIWIGAAIAIKVSSKGPILFRQERVGRWGETFRLYKLRTMVTDAEERLSELRELNEADGPLFKMENDPRITRVGRVLRRTSIDELPQLFNVIRGEMSLVGPRPALPSEAQLWGSDLFNRLRVSPGITGMWQVSGRSSSSFADYERLDLYYVDNWSILIDLGILARTIPVVLSSRGAC